MISFMTPILSIHKNEQQINCFPQPLFCVDVMNGFLREIKCLSNLSKVNLSKIVAEWILGRKYWKKL